jgi:predicted Zn-dependent protease
VKDAAVAGVVYELLKRIAGLGREIYWMGSIGIPAMVIDGVSVTGR